MAKSLERRSGMKVFVNANFQSLDETTKAG